MSRKYSLAHLTALNHAPPEFTYLAAKAGYDYVSLRLIPLGLPGEPSYLPEDKAMLRRTRAALAETGLRVLDLELARIIDGVDPLAYLPAMEAAAELGAKHVITSAWTGNRQGKDFHVDFFATLCHLAKPLGLTMDLEFPAFSSIQNLQSAADVVRTARCDNGGLLVDMLYIHFARTAPEDIARLPAEWFRFAHLCDAPAEIPMTTEGQIKIARSGRLYPGEGAIDIAGIVHNLPVDLPLSIELPNPQRAEALGHEEYARRCLLAAKEYIERHVDERAPVPLPGAAALGAPAASPSRVTKN